MNNKSIKFRDNKPALIVNGLSKSFNGKEVLKNISFEIDKGEVLGIIGPSGSGKTTLLKCLNLLEILDLGRIEYPDLIAMLKKSATDSLLKKTDNNSYIEILDEEKSILRKKVGFVFQGFNLWEDKTVLYNLTLAPKLLKNVSKELLISEASELAKEFDVENKLNSYVFELSGGQRQRVAIIRALMMKPEILLLDEITSALDPILTVGIMNCIKKLQNDGYTMIIVTHHIEFASKVCDRIMFLDDGIVIQCDTPTKLRSHPKNNKVEEFLNILTEAR